LRAASPGDWELTKEQSRNSGLPVRMCRQFHCFIALENPMSFKRQVTVTLPVDSWQAIMRLITSSAQSKGNEWVIWGEDVNRIILRSMYDPARKRANQPTTRRQHISAADELAHDHDSSSSELYNPDFGG